MRKRFFDSIDTVEVTFELERPDAVSVAVALDWRDWEELPLRRFPSGTGPFTIKLRVPADREVQYRFLVNGTEWLNDPAADGEVDNAMGSKNSVLVTSPGT